MTRAIHWGDDPKLPTWRLVVEDDDGDGLITIQEELATSTSERAQTERVLAAVYLREDEARWLHAELGELLAARDALRRVRLPGWPGLGRSSHWTPRPHQPTVEGRCAMSWVRRGSTCRAQARWFEMLLPWHHDDEVGRARRAELEADIALLDGCTDCPGSDLYIYESCEGGICCCGCILSRDGDSGFVAKNEAEMFAHILEHDKAGHHTFQYLLDQARKAGVR